MVSQIHCANNGHNFRSSFEEKKKKKILENNNKTWIVRIHSTSTSIKSFFFFLFFIFQLIFYGGLPDSHGYHGTWEKYVFYTRPGVSKKVKIKLNSYITVISYLKHLHSCVLSKAFLLSNKCCSVTCWISIKCWTILNTVSPSSKDESVCSISFEIFSWNFLGTKKILMYFVQIVHSIYFSF